MPVAEGVALRAKLLISDSSLMYSGMQHNRAAEAVSPLVSLKAPTPVSCTAAWPDAPSSRSPMQRSATGQMELMAWEQGEHERAAVLRCAHA